MYGINTPKRFNNESIRKKTSRGHTNYASSAHEPRSLFTSENEALTVFNQVQANKDKILGKSSRNAFYSKTTVKTIKLDPNGNKIIEKFESTAFGGFNQNGEKIGEVAQQYCNKNTGTEKSSLQRVIGSKIRRIQTKRTSGFEQTDELCENCDSEFDNEWKEKAKMLGAKKIESFETKLNSISPLDDL
jgi:hypothetical protein